MRCRCGNEQGEPRVSPFPVSFVDVKTRQEVFIYYNGGFVEGGWAVGDPDTDPGGYPADPTCWFCTFPR
jgi:hypothetical protein